MKLRDNEKQLMNVINARTNHLYFTVKSKKNHYRQLLNIKM